MKSSGVSAYYRIDVTALAREWYLGKGNRGIVLTPSPDMPNTVRFCSAEGTRKPYLQVEYTGIAGLEDYLTYDVHSAGRAGTGYVSLCSGNLVCAHGDTSMSGAAAPVSVTHYYNACDSDRDDFGAGKGWRTNLHRTLHKEAGRYVYTDGDGTRHTFEGSGGTNKDTSGLGLTLTVTGGEAEIRDKGDNTITFALPAEELTAWNRGTA